VLPGLPSNSLLPLSAFASNAQGFAAAMVAVKHSTPQIQRPTSSLGHSHHIGNAMPCHAKQGTEQDSRHFKTSFR
jgi:hypothetical protein